MWTRNAQQILGLERHGDFGWHAVLRILVALSGIPEMMGENCIAKPSGAGQGRGDPVRASDQASR